jgi:acyl-CoA synthetase (AMP-forming)/AMP-acid ligase II
MTAEAEHNIVGFLAGAAKRCATRKAFVLQDPRGRETAVSFAELWDRVDRTGTGFRAAGLKAGDRAILMIPMSIDLYVALLAVLRNGAIAVFVDPWVGRRQIAAFASFAKATAWIGIPKSHLLRLTDSCLRKLPLTITTGRRWFGWGGRFTLQELQRQPGDQQVAAVDADDTAMITFTSGSSGLPKGVNRTHGFLTAQHAALQQEFPQLDGDVDMPMFPVFALNNLARGIPSIVPTMDFRYADRVDGRLIAEQMRRNQTTTCTASPPFLDRLAEHQQAHPSKGVFLRRIMTGGAPVTDTQLEAWRRVWPDTELIVVYGSTEAEPVGHIDAADRLELQPTPPRNPAGYCIGKPSHLVQLRVIKIHDGPISLADDGWKGWELPAGEAGELVVSGKHVAQSYFENPAATAENKLRDADGTVWHRMGDTGYVDDRGYVWLVGRVHSTIYRDGRAVHPQLVEQAGAAGHEAIQRIAAVGLPDESLGERVIVVVETTAGGDLLEQVRQRIEQAKLPVDEVRLAKTALPLDPRHRSKIDYPALREQLLNS